MGNYFSSKKSSTVPTWTWTEDGINRSMVILSNALDKWPVVVHHKAEDKMQLLRERLHLQIPDTFEVSKIRKNGCSWLLKSPSMMVTHKMTGKQYCIIFPQWYETQTQIAFDEHFILNERHIYGAGIEMSPHQVKCYQEEP